MSLSSRSRLSLALPALALVFATACGAAAPPTASPAPPTPAPTRTPYDVNVPASLQGAWQADIVGGTTVTNGVWSMVISENEISVTNPKAGPSDAFALGVTAITADQVNFYVDQECQAGNVFPDGTYTYEVVDDQLTFTLIQDLCRDRSNLLTAAPWVRQL